MWLHSLKVAQLLRSAACLHTNQSRSYLNHLVLYYALTLRLRIPSCHHLPEDGGHTHETCTRACKFRESVIFCIIYVLLLVYKIHYNFIISFLLSNFRRVLNVVCFLLGNFPASEFYTPTFRNTLSVPSL